MVYNLLQLKQTLIQQGLAWVYETRGKYINSARNLTSSESSILKNWFPSRILENAKISMVEQVDNPPFVEQIRQMKLTSFDYRKCTAVTFDNIILVATININPVSSAYMPVLFHELAHVVQSDILGVQKFVELYVDDVIKNNFIYEKISFEINAYDLQGKFITSPNEYFSVEEEVKKFLIDKSL